MKLKILLILLIAWTIPKAVFAQQAITGKVVDKENNSPLPGVNIVVKGTSNGTITDAEGDYSITVKTTDILIFSFLGYTPEEQSVGSQTTINVSLAPDVQLLSEIVVTGYQTLEKTQLTGAVSTANVEELNKESVPSLATALQGRLPGIQVSGDGTPGGGNTNISLRGFSSTGENRPLFVIDGVPTMDGVNMINPKDIESIQVLKDAASASIYGARANNGVIVITTKQGSGNRVVLTFDAAASVQMLRNRIDVLNSKEWGDVYWQAKRNAGEVPSHPQYGSGAEPIMPSFIDTEKIIPAANTDWVNESFNPALMQNYNIGLSNSSEKGSVYFNLSYLDQDGIMKYTGFDRLTARLNTSFNLYGGKLKVGENLLIARTNQVAIADPAFTHQILFQHPLIPVYDINGDFGGPTDGLGDKRNPIAALYQNKDNVGKGTRVFGNLFAELELMKGLSLKTNLGIDYNTFYQKTFNPKWKEGTRSVDQNSLSVGYRQSLNTTWTNTLNYVRRTGDHNVNALIGMETNTGTYEDLGGRRQSFLLENTDYTYLNAGTGTQTNYNGGSDWSLISYFAKADYAFKDKYLASATIRRDASSRLDPTNNFDYFPAVAVGWRITEESFMPESTFLTDLKIRAGYGTTGNQAIGDYSAYTIYTMDLENSRYNFSGDNSSPTAGYKVFSHGNPQVRWETAKQFDAGADISLFDGHVGLVADYYVKRNEDILVNPPRIAAEGEGNAPYINAGIIENKGWEFAVNYNGTIHKEISFKAGINLGTYRNEVISLGSGNDYFTGPNANRVVPGQPVSVFYGYVADGLFKTVDEISNHADQGLPANELGLGRIRYKDLNNDGMINDQDRTYIGNPHPSFIYGISVEAGYKNFDLSLLFDGVQGRDIYNVFRQMTDFTYWNFNYGVRTLDAWSPSNPDSDIPAVSTTNSNNEYRNSSYFVDDGSYFRLKTISIGYTIPESVLSKIKINSARIFFQGQNLFTVTKYIGMDYEVGARGALDFGIDNQFYPHSKNVTLGLNVGF
jgi:TonB-dependent starch-binding outer membrane protein SusC